MWRFRRGRGAEVGQACVTAGGHPRNPGAGSHRERWNDYQSRMRDSRFVVKVNATRERLTFVTGELYLAEIYRLDPEKATLPSRLSDGRVPECNQYLHQVAWQGWAA